MSFSLENIIKISKDVAGFFRYATEDNPSCVVNQWKNHEQEEKAQRIYANCVRCNVKRFKPYELNYYKAYGKGLDTYFCNSCMKKVSEFYNSKDRGFATEENKIFFKFWNDYLYGKNHKDIPLKSQL